MIRLLDSRSLALRIMGDSIMKEQIIITIGRESGSGGHAIAKKIADEMGCAPQTVANKLKEVGGK